MIARIAVYMGIDQLIKHQLVILTRKRFLALFTQFKKKKKKKNRYRSPSSSALKGLCPVEEEGEELWSSGWG